MKILFYFLIFMAFVSCKNKANLADKIFYNAQIITMNDSQVSASVLIIKDGKILAIGNNELINAYVVTNDSNKIDVKGQFIYPGFIDAHCHFYGYATTKLTCNLVGTVSWKDVINKIDSFAQTTESAWIKGRGWDQNNWIIKEYPNNSLLNKMFPDRPVLLKRIDGHGAICNQKALILSGIDIETEIPGGEIEKKDGKLTGILVDNAVDWVEKIITAPQKDELIGALKEAEKECFALGITTLADAGLDLNTCLYLDSLGNKTALNIYLYLMLNPTYDGLRWAQENGILENNHTKICSFKLYADGALGSRGAKLKQDYCDRDNYTGMLLNSVGYFENWCQQIKTTTQYQVNTHCIGDSANRLLLEIYGKYLKGKNDERWRIEHAQVIDLSDFDLFSKYSIIPSVQPTHATSDAPWAEHRLCNHRMKGAYAYQTLLKTNDYLPLGTDFPVEYLNPLYTYYSAVFRKNATKPNQTEFQIEEQLKPLEALKGMTIWAAKACRLEHRKGSLEKGKDADFIITDKNILTLKSEDVLKLKILKTYSCGKSR